MATENQIKAQRRSLDGMGLALQDMEEGSPHKKNRINWDAINTYKKRRKYFLFAKGSPDETEFQILEEIFEKMIEPIREEMREERIAKIREQFLATDDQLEFIEAATGEDYRHRGLTKIQARKMIDELTKGGDILYDLE